MKAYANRNGKSGIIAYHIGNDYIDIQFASGGIYRYKESNIGRLNFLNMQAAAIIGSGLNSFINRVVRRKNS